MKTVVMIFCHKLMENAMVVTQGTIRMSFVVFADVDRTDVDFIFSRTYSERTTTLPCRGLVIVNEFC